MKPHQLPARVAKRIKIQKLASQGYSQRQIVKNLKVSKSTVERLVCIKSARDKKNSERPRKCSPQTRSTIQRTIIEKLGASSKKTALKHNIFKKYKN